MFGFFSSSNGFLIVKSSTTYWNMLYNSSILALRLLSGSNTTDFTSSSTNGLFAAVVSYFSRVILDLVKQFDSAEWNWLAIVMLLILGLKTVKQ